MADTIQVAFQMEEEIKKKVPVRPPMDEVTRSERTFVDPIRSKLPDRSSCSTLAPSQSSCGGNIRSKCFNCQSFGHHARDCPSKLNMPIKSDAMIENEETKEAKETEETKLYHQAIEPLDPEFDDDFQDDVIGNIRPLLVTKGANREPQELQHGQIFHTRVKYNNQVCSLVIDTGSCTNVVSEETVKKLGLKLSHIKSLIMSHGYQHKAQSREVMSCCIHYGKAQANRHV